MIRKKVFQAIVIKADCVKHTSRGFTSTGWRIACARILCDGFRNDAAQLRYESCCTAWVALLQTAATHALAALIEETRPVVARFRDYKRASDGDLGPVYGVQWRSWPTPGGGHIDQIQQVMDTLKTNPDSRRIIVSAWNVAELDQMALMPCHAFFQFYVAPPQNPGDKPRLSCQLYQRSADIFLGVPFNIASYALLTHMVAQQCDMDVGDFIWTGGDCHIYSNHHEQVELQLSRTPMAYPTLNIKRKPDSILDYAFEDFEVVGYECHPAIKAPVAV